VSVERLDRDTTCPSFALNRDVFAFQKYIKIKKGMNDTNGTSEVRDRPKIGEGGALRFQLIWESRSTIRLTESFQDEPNYSSKAKNKKKEK